MVFFLVMMIINYIKKKTKKKLIIENYFIYNFIVKKIFTDNDDIYK